MELAGVDMKALLFVILILIIALAIAVIKFAFKAVFFRAWTAV